MGLKTFTGSSPLFGQKNKGYPKGYPKISAVKRWIKLEDSPGPTHFAKGKLPYLPTQMLCISVPGKHLFAKNMPPAYFINAKTLTGSSPPLRAKK